MESLIKTKMKIKKIRRKNKKAMSLAIAFLVLATLILTVFSLLVFNIRKNDLSGTIGLASFERIYAREEVLNFYVEDIMEQSVVNVETEQQFIQNFKETLSHYTYGGEFFLEELNQVREQLMEGNTEIKEEKIFLNLTIKIADYVGDDPEIYVSYKYVKKFEKEISNI